MAPTEEQLAATSGDMRTMSEERSEVLEYMPAHFKVLVYLREVWSNSVGEIGRWVRGVSATDRAGYFVG